MIMDLWYAAYDYLDHYGCVLIMNDGLTVGIGAEGYNKYGLFVCTITIQQLIHGTKTEAIS